MVTTAAAALIIAVYLASWPTASLAQALRAVTTEPETGTPKALSAEEEAYAVALWPIHSEVATTAANMTTAGIIYATENHDAHELATKVAPLANTMALDEYRARGLDVPPSMQRVQDQYLEAIRLYQEAAAETLVFTQDRLEEHLLTAQSKSLHASENLLRVGDVLWPGEHKPN